MLKPVGTAIFFYCICWFIVPVATDSSVFIRSNIVCNSRKRIRVCLSLQNRRDFLRILGEQTRKRGEREARVTRARRSVKKIPPVPRPLFRCSAVPAVPAFIYERGYPIRYLTSRDPRTFLNLCGWGYSGIPPFISGCYEEEMRMTSRFVRVEIQTAPARAILLPPFSLIRDFGKLNTRGNVSKIYVSLTCYRQIGSKSTNHSHECDLLTFLRHASGLWLVDFDPICR